VRKTLEYFGFGLLILLMIVAILTFFAPRFGWRLDAVMSGSMEPELKVGGLVITRPVESQNIKIGDTITFYCPLSKKMTSHRVILVSSSTLSYFRTKGDANEDPDPFIVPVQNVVGKVCFHIPYLGYFTQFIKTPLGIILTLCIPGCIVVVMEIRNICKALRTEQIERKHQIKWEDER
jgi:signal peptidase